MVDSLPTLDTLLRRIISFKTFEGWIAKRKKMKKGCNLNADDKLLRMIIAIRWNRKTVAASGRGKIGAEHGEATGSEPPKKFVGNLLAAPKISFFEV